ncbi:hypothetical protein [Ichthyenterobacterium magnum]|uniref:Uncharacterized protein n=1 Tax=Ichthyenterobacterium magnum TaxID=1230530 RepID=A0A420DWS2_9FLAO|nr:hypothetical protein [Ichthyenterobacterium magnum]RKE98653.1 hypothetical protein BXY80_0746 [Ichthyenterobacterium magnum]
MNKNVIAIFFSVLFMALITAPSIIIAVDDSCDVSIFYSITEEEEKESLKIVPTNELSETECLFASNSNDNLGYFFKSYLNPHINILSPPPDFI